MKEFVDRLQSLMNLILVCSVAVLLVPHEEQSILELADRAQDDAKRVQVEIDKLKEILPRESIRRPALADLASAASHLLEVSP